MLYNKRKSRKGELRARLRAISKRLIKIQDRQMERETLSDEEYDALRDEEFELEHEISEVQMKLMRFD